MSSMETMHLACPHCALDFRAEVWTVVGATEDPDLREELLAGRFNVLSCPYCERESFMPVPFLYYDQERQFALGFVAQDWGGEEEAQAVINRLLGTLAAERGDLQLDDYLLEPEILTSLEAVVLAIREAESLEDPIVLAGGLRALSGVASDDDLIAVLNQYPQLLTDETLGLLRRTAYQQAEQGFPERAEYFASLADFLEAQQPLWLEEPETELRDPTEALTHLLRAETEEDFWPVLDDHPELLTPRAVHALRDMAHRAQREGKLPAAQRFDRAADWLDDALTALALEAAGEEDVVDLSALFRAAEEEPDGREN